MAPDICETQESLRAGSVYDIYADALGCAFEIFVKGGEGEAFVHCEMEVDGVVNR
jgi:hypothetical protein